MTDIPAALLLLASFLVPGALAVVLLVFLCRSMGRQYGLRALMAALTLWAVLLGGGVGFGREQFFYGACWAATAALFAWVACGVLIGVVTQGPANYRGKGPENASSP